MGAVHGADPDRADRGRRSGHAEDAELGLRRRSRTRWSIGGGQGGIALGARLRQLGVPAIVVDKHERPGDQWRKRYKSLCLHDPVWYDHLPYLPFPRQLAGVRAEGQDRRLARVLHPGDGGAVLVEARRCLSATFDEAAESGPSRSTATASALTLRPTQLVLATGMSGKPQRARRCPGRTSSAATSTTPVAHPGPGRATSARRPW